MPDTSLTADQAGAWIARDQNPWAGPVIRYSFATGFPDGYDGAEGFEAFNADQQAVTELALGLWADVADITFQLVGADEETDIRFFAYDMTVPDQAEGDEPVTDPDDSEPDDSPGWGYGQGPNSPDGADVRVNTNKPGWAGLGTGVANLGGLGLMVHEIGHALGLSHPGDYDVGFITPDIDGDGDVDSTDVLQNYDTWADYIEDTTQYSIMSYWPGWITGAFTDGNPALSPLLHDIAAVQQDFMYGPAVFTRFGDTTYGFNSNADRIIYRFDELSDAEGTLVPVLAIYDTGGTDTLDVSGYGDDQAIDLTPGAFSDIGGLEKNISTTASTFIENAVGGSGNDTITGNDRDNTLTGNAGNDTINGGAGNDIAQGGSGEDWISGAEGNDSLYGGDNMDNVHGDAGNDTIHGDGGGDWLRGDAGRDYVYGGDGADYIYGDGDGELTDIKEVTETAAGTGHEDYLFGGNDWDYLYGGDGIDYLSGGDGDDFLMGGPGSDIIFGGNGTDTIGYGYTAFDWNIRLDLGQSRIGGVVHETFGSIENADMGSGNDVVQGSDVANVVWGNIGADTLFGAGGNDTLYGGSDRDALIGGIDDDTVYGGTGNDQLMGEAGADNLEGGDGNDTLAGGDDSDTLRGEAGNDALTGGSGLEFLFGGDGDDEAAGEADADWVYGGNGNDRIAGDTGADYLVGGRGNDTVHGGTEADRIVWGPGNGTPPQQTPGGPPMPPPEPDAGDPFDGDDIYDGGADIDILDYDGTLLGVDVNLSRNSDHGFGLEIGTDQIAGIENVVGGAGNDFIFGDSAVNELHGGSGNDTLGDGLGNDMLFGGNGNDVFEGRAGNVFGPVDDDDIFAGGDGTDTISYSSALGGITIQLHTLNIAGAPRAFGAAIGTDTLVSIENAAGGDGFDTIEGNSGINTLIGNRGNDRIAAGLGNDIIYAGDGNDLVYLDSGNDTLFGGNGGNDALEAGSAGLGVTIRFDLGTTSGATIGSDTIDGFEAFNGSAHADTVVGSDGAEYLYLRSGNDTGSGGGGNDMLFGYNGVDMLAGGDGNDTLYGGADNDTLAGDVGNDRLYLDAGDDALDGGEGTADIVDAWQATSGVTVNLSTGTATGGGIGSDTLAGFERVYGSQYADNIFGGAADDYLYARNGANVVFGNDGNDTLYGGVDTDTLLGGAGNDLADGGSGNDLIYADAGDDMLFGGADSADVFDAWYAASGIAVDLGAGTANGGGFGSDTLAGFERAYGSQHGDTLAGGGGDDYLYARDGADILSGGGGNDLLYAVSGDDTLDGGAGNDWLDGGLGADSATGGDGNDTFIFRTNDFVGAPMDIVADFAEIDGSNRDTLRLQGTALDYTFADAVGHVAVTHLATGAAIQVNGMTVAALADQVIYF